MQQQRPVGDQRRDGDLHQPLMADVLGRDVELARLAAADVGMHGPRRHLPAGRPFVLVLGNQGLDLFRIQDLRRRPQNAALPIRTARVIAAGWVVSWP